MRIQIVEVIFELLPIKLVATNKRTSPSLYCANTHSLSDCSLSEWMQTALYLLRSSAMVNLSWSKSYPWLRNSCVSWSTSLFVLQKINAFASPLLSSTFQTFGITCITFHSTTSHQFNYYIIHEFFLFHPGMLEEDKILRHLQRHPIYSSLSPPPPPPHLVTRSQRLTANVDMHGHLSAVLACQILYLKSILHV